MPYEHIGDKRRSESCPKAHTGKDDSIRNASLGGRNPG